LTLTVDETTITLGAYDLGIAIADEEVAQCFVGLCMQELGGLRQTLDLGHKRFKLRAHLFCITLAAFDEAQKRCFGAWEGDVFSAQRSPGLIASARRTAKPLPVMPLTRDGRAITSAGNSTGHEHFHIVQFGAERLVDASAIQMGDSFLRTRLIEQDNPDMCES